MNQGTIKQLRPAHAVEPLLTKKQLGERLGRSVRWIELRTREGMPSRPPTTRDPHRRFRVSEVQAWLAAGEKKTPGHAERIAQLEQQVQRLVGEIERLKRLTAERSGGEK